jgi:predicted RNase H-like HicB family nuclease
MLRYSMLIQWSNTDNAYIVTVPELPGCKAQGDTYEEASKHGREVLEQLLEGSEKLGMPLPEPTLYQEEEQVEKPTTRQDVFDVSQANSCSFCENIQEQAQQLTAGPGNVNICNDCVDVCRKLMESGIHNFDDMRIELAKRSPRKEKVEEVQKHIEKMKEIRQRW